MYAITHIAVHDALNAIHRRYEPYAYRGPGARRGPRCRPLLPPRPTTQWSPH